MNALIGTFGRRSVWGRWLAVAPALATAWALGLQAMGQGDLLVYGDSLVNGFADWSWASRNLAATTPVHSGVKSISVTAGAWQALYLHHDDFDSGLYASISFWINGGATGGQRLQVQGLLSGKAQSSTVSLAPLPANTWLKITLSLTELNVANRSNFSGFWIQDRTGTAQPTFYVDDIVLVAQPPPSIVNLEVDASQVVRVVDNRVFGVNTAIWDSQFDTAATRSLLEAIDIQALRFPGGSLSDDYHWASNTTDANTWTWATSFDKFAAIATNLHAQVFITANYGTGTPSEAAAWVRYANVTRRCGFKYWEIGNENYGGWETDSNAVPHDPYTYANRAADYLAQMKAVDASVKVGVVAVTGEDSYANNTAHPALNPRTGVRHNGWTPVLLTTLRALGVTPDFVIYHRYPQNPGQEDDTGLLLSSKSWPADASDLRQQLTDYLGGVGAGVELVCTENNSVSSGPGKQTTSLVDGLFLADSTGQLLQTEFNALLWWDLRNGRDTNGNQAPTLYGWLPYGDYGMISGPASCYPTYYVARLLSFFARGGDQIIRVRSDYPLLAAYGALRTDGSVALMVINKSVVTNLAANVILTGYQPDSIARVYSYGIPQDDAARTGVGSLDVASSSWTNAGVSFTYSFEPYSVTVLSLVPAPPRLAVVAVPTAAGTPLTLQLTGQAGATYRLDGSTDLASWSFLATKRLTSSTWTWSDLGSTNLTWRFYRALWAQ